ncbi:MAG TPA: hypothetical protein VNR60_11650 [Croceibacterium sp.]|nr:hypothetical protein [Croceibacterium sp.]
MGLLLPAILIIAAIIGVIIWRGRQFGELARRGVPVMGQIDRKFRTGTGQAGSRGRRIAFVYRGPDGVEYRRAASVTLGKWAELEEGAPIALVCLPDKPGVSAPAWLVEEARKALKLQS